jgi:DNA-binding transcriptional LysR family regulator
VVAEEGSIVAAATRLRIAQPALSRQIQRLERDVGVRLVERRRRGISLTPAGTALLAGTSDLISRIDQAFQRALSADAGTRGVVRVGLSRLMLDNPRIGLGIAAVRGQFPDVRIDINEVGAMEQGQALRDRSIDVGIGLTGNATTPGISREELYEESIDSALISSSHPLATQRVLDIASLRDVRLLLVAGTLSGGYNRLGSAIERARIAPVELHDSLESVYRLVAAGRGWTLGFSSMRMHPPLGTVCIPVKGFRQRTAVCVRWRSDDDSRALANLLHVLRQESGDARARRDARRPRLEPTERRRATGVPANLELGQLEALCAAIEEGSLSRAAARLRLTQSGVSRRIEALERALGFRLLHRVAHGVVGTTAGEELRRQTGDLLRAADRALAKARNAARGVSGACRIGTLPAELTARFQVNALRMLVERYPHLALEVTEMMPEFQVTALRERRIDVGISGVVPGLAMHPAVEGVTLIDDPVDCILIAQKHPLAARAWITAHDLATEPFLFIARSSGPKLYEAVMKNFEDIGLQPLVNATYNGPRAVWRAAADFMGWTIGSRSQRAHPPAGLVAIPVQGLHIPWGIGVVWRRGEEDSSIRNVLDVFRESRNSEVPLVVITARANDTASV